MAADSSDETWLQEEFRSSEDRFRTNFEAIIAKYNKPFENSDELDLTTMTVVRDRGHLRKGKNHKFGHSKLAVSKRRDMTYIQNSEDSTIWGKADETQVSMMHSKLPHILINDEISDAETISSESSSSGNESDSEDEDTDDRVYSSQDSPLHESPATDSRKVRNTKSLKPWTFTNIKQEKKSDSHEYESPADDNQGNYFLPQQVKLDFNQHFEKDDRKSKLFCNAVLLTPDRASNKSNGFIALTPENYSFRTLSKPSGYTPVTQLHSPNRHLRRIQTKLAQIDTKSHYNQVHNLEKENESNNISKCLTMALDTEPISGSPNFALNQGKSMDYYQESTKLANSESDVHKDKGDSGFETWSSISHSGVSSLTSSCFTPKSSKRYPASSSTGKKLRISSTRAKQLISIPRFSNEDIIKILTSPEPAVKNSTALNSSPTINLTAGIVSTPTNSQERKISSLRQADMIADAKTYSAPPKLVPNLSVNNANAQRMWRSRKRLKLLQNSRQDLQQETKDDSPLELEYLSKDSAIATENSKKYEAKKPFMDTTYLIGQRQQKFGSGDSLKGVCKVPNETKMEDKDQNECKNYKLLQACQSCDNNKIENDSDGKKADYKTWGKDMKPRSPAYIFAKLKTRATLEKLDRQHSSTDMRLKEPQREETSLKRISTPESKDNWFGQVEVPKSITFAEFLQRNHENIETTKKDAQSQVREKVRQEVNLIHRLSDAPRIHQLVRPASLTSGSQETSQQVTKYLDKHIPQLVNNHSNELLLKQPSTHKIHPKYNFLAPTSKFEENEIIIVPSSPEKKNNKVTPSQARVTSTPEKKSAKIFDISSISMIVPSQLESRRSFKQKQVKGSRGCLFRGSDEECEDVVTLNVLKESPENRNTKNVSSSKGKDCIKREEKRPILSVDEHLKRDKEKTENCKIEKGLSNDPRSNQGEPYGLGRQTKKPRKTGNILGYDSQEKRRLLDVYDIDKCTDFYITNSAAIQNSKGYKAVYAREKVCARTPGGSTDSSVASQESLDNTEIYQSRHFRAKRKGICSKVNPKCNDFSTSSVQEVRIKEEADSPNKRERSYEKHKEINMLVVNNGAIFVKKKPQVRKSDEVTFSKKTVLSNYEINSTLKSSKRNRFTSSSEEDTPKRRCFLNSPKHLNSVRNTPPELSRTVNKSIQSPSQCKGQGVCKKSFCFECT